MSTAPHAEPSLEIAAPPHASPETVRLHDEFRHLKSYWLCFLSMGILLVTCATAAVLFPALTIITSFAAIVILGIA